VGDGRIAVVSVENLAEKVPFRFIGKLVSELKPQPENPHPQKPAPVTDKTS
jgi:hypothetical protein